MLTVGKVGVQVKDQDRALNFWTKLGFEVTVDAPYRQERWLEVRSPDRNISLVLSLNEDGPVTATASEDLPTSNVMFVADDVVATHAEMAAKGVEFPQPPVEQPFGWWAMFADEEGNRYALGQRDR
jgi:predicted enzyme related to lactoylglutathione lyase